MNTAGWRHWLRRASKSPTRVSPKSKKWSRFRFLFERLEERCVPSSSSWNNFSGNAQHTGVSAVEAGPMDTIRWQMSIDKMPSGPEHYGEPVFTPSNTVMVAVKTGQTANFVLDGINGSTGSVLWSAPTDYTQPPNFTWLPPFQSVYDPVNDRVYFAGNGGTLYYINHPDNPGSSNPIPTQVAFYGIANYTTNPSAYNASIFIDSPLTVDNSGNVFFGFTETGSNPLGISQGGIARIGADGSGTYVLAGTAAGAGSGVDEAAIGSAPAVSNDGSIVYAAVNSIANAYNGYLVGVDSTTLAPVYSAFLVDPASGNPAGVIAESTAGPMVAPDGTVFMGVFGSPFNGSRGFLLHFSGNLTSEFTPGAFGWDDTPSIIPTSMIPSYNGSSSYLVLSKYNNYVAAETGAFLGGNGVNQIAILDPYASQLDPNYDFNPNLQVMKQILTLPSPTPDTQFNGSGFLDAVREWCTNGTAVDPASDSVFINNEDGYAYRWNLTTNVITQAVEITNGIGEPYTPTAVGPDGTIYAINGGTLFSLGGYSNYTETFTTLPSPSVVGQGITFTAALQSTTGGATPTGSVTFSYTEGANNPLNSTPVVLATVSLVNGVATYSTSSLGAGHYHVVASYSGDGTYGAGSSTLVQVVLDTAKVSLTASNSTVLPGSPVTFTATITPSTLDVVPLGTVTFEGGGVFGTVQLSNQNAVNFSRTTTATLTISSLPAGAFDIFAVYSGDQNLGQTSSNTVGLTVYTALIPPPVVTTNTDISNPSVLPLTNHVTPTVTNNSAPSVAVDPLNPQDLVTAWVSNSTISPPPFVNPVVEAAYSKDGGNTWNALPLPGNLIDPTSSTTNPTVFPQDIEPSVAFDTQGNVYIVYLEQKSGASAGAMVLQKFSFPAGSTPTQTINTGVINEWTTGGVFTPMVAVDTSLQSPFVNNVYVTYSSKDVAPKGVQNFNPNSIWVVASSDGGNNFSAPLQVNSNGFVGPEQDGVPQIAISGGTPDGRVPAGQVNIVYEDFNSGAKIKPTPLGFINYNSFLPGVASAFASTGGNLKDAGSGTPNVPAVTDFTQTVNVDSRFTSLTNLTASLQLTQPNLSEIQIQLINDTLLQDPTGLVFGPNGNLFISSQQSNSIQEAIGTSGQFAGHFVSTNGGLNAPSYMVFGPNGDLYVSNQGTNSITYYNGTTGALLGTFVSSGSGGLTAPEGLAFGADGNLYVSSAGTNQVLEYSGQDGTFKGIFASGNGLSSPMGLVFGPDGNLYVSSQATNNVLQFNGATGAFIKIFASNAALSGPNGLVFGPDGNLYVSSQSNGSVLKFDGKTGAFISTFVASGSGGLQSPSGLAFGLDGSLYVSDFARNRVLRYTGTSGAFIDVFSFAATLLRNRTNAAGASNNNVGTSGANLGSTANGVNIPTVFDNGSDLSINNTISGAAAPYAGHFSPDFDPATQAGLDAFDGLSAADLNGTWTLEITDFRNDGNQNPIPNLSNWSITLSSGFTLAPGGEKTIATTTVLGALTSPFPTKLKSNPGVGVGPSPVIASDNTDGANSAYSGRLYVAYVDRVIPVNPGDSTDNTNIQFLYSDDGGKTWNGSTRVNDDNATTDGFSGAVTYADAGRPAYEPDIAVDQSTGTLVLSWYDGRNDPSLNRVARYVTTSIDGGHDFSPDVFLNVPEAATDEITGKTVALGPIPDNNSSSNPKADGTFGFGDRQGMAVANGHIVAVWSGNFNGGFNGHALLDILSATATFAAGPRIIKSTQGPVAAPINNDRAPDGTLLADAFEVTFDRPVAAFPTSAVTIMFQDAKGDAPVSLTITGVTPLNPGAFGPAGASGASVFLVTFDPSLANVIDGTYVGTYSYAIGTGVQSFIGDAASSSLVAAVAMDQDANGIPGQANGDVYAVPQPDGNGGSAFQYEQLPGYTNQYGQPQPTGVPFHGPYNQSTVPLIVPGPHIVNSFVPGLSSGSDNLVLNGTVSFMDVTFDRNMDPSSFTFDQVVRLMGPVGEIGPNGVVKASFSVTPDPQFGEDPNHPRTFRINFLTADGKSPLVLNLNGTYTLTLGTKIKSAAGDFVDTNENAGLDILRATPSAGTTPVTYNSPNVPVTITAGQTIKSALNISDSYLIQGITLQLDITYPHDPDLQAILIGPNNTSVTLFSGIGKNGDQQNFTNTVFDDAATTPIAGGTPAFTGRFNPFQALDAFSGGLLSANGTWTLEIIDTGIGSVTGTLNSWSLTLLKPVPLTGLGEPVADQATVSFRIFTMDPSNPLSSSTWTSVGPAENGSGHGRIGGIAVDPSDPSGNTVYVAGASGGVWKTTDFLTTSPGGPTYIPLTDFGPTFGINIGSLAVFGRNNDTTQSIVIASTGEGDTSSPGVGFLRSMDGGATWTLLDSTKNVDANGNPLPLNSSQRDHIFVGTTSFKVLVDPNPTPSGNVIIYAALSGTNGGIWRSTDTGNHWTLMRAGQATDIVFDPNSGRINSISNPTGNLDVLYAAFAGDGVYVTPNRGKVWNELLGTSGDPNILNGDNSPLKSVPVAAPSSNPNGAKGRIVLAKPALTGSFLPDGSYTGNVAQDLLYEGWLYALVVQTNNHLDGLYVTKDFGQTWTKVRMPTLPDTSATGGSNLYGNPTNDTTQADYDVFGKPGGEFTQGNYDVSMAVDPDNPNVVYLGGTQDGQTPLFSGLIRVDIIGLSDPHAFYLSNNNTDGQVRTLSTSPVTIPNWPNGTKGFVGPFLNPYDSPFINLIRNPASIFDASSQVVVSDFATTGQFANTGSGATWTPFDIGGTDQHRIVTMRDPLTGEARLIIGDDQGIYSALDDNGSRSTGAAIGVTETGGGNADRNGNLDIAQFYYGASQPSDLAAQVAGALFYTGVQDGASDFSAASVLSTGNLTWGNNGVGDSGGVATDQTGTGTLYQYVWPCCGGNTTDFFKVNSVGRTFGLIQVPSPDPQWPLGGVLNFTVNPIAGSQIAISSAAGRIFASEDQGLTWFVIGNPANLDGKAALALAYGAPDPNDPSGALNDFLYAGTNGGHIFVTFDGGGASGNDWINLSAGLDGSAVQAIVTNPTRGSHEAYAVTFNGVYHMVDATASGATWVKITGNLFQLTHNLFTPFNDSTQLVGTQLAYLTSIVADWRYAIPDSAGNLHPVLYVGGEGGVYRSEDNGQTWTIFPDSADDHAPQDGGYLPNAHVTDLQLAIGKIDSTTGRPVQTSAPDVLLATTYGRGAFAIRVAPVIVKNSFQLDPSMVTGPNNTTNQASPLFDGMSELSPLPGSTTIRLYDANGNSIGADPNNLANNFVSTDSTGKFKIEIAPGVIKADGSGDGTYTVYVQAKDAAGTVGPMTAITFTLVTPVPSFQTIFLDPKQPSPAGSDSGRSNSDGITNDSQPFIAGLLVQGGPLALTLYDVTNNPNSTTVIGTGTSNADGTFSIQVNTPFTSDGVKTIKIVATHTPAGTPGVFSFTLDTTPPATPAAPALQGDNGQHTTNSSTPVFTGTVEPNDQVLLFVDGNEVDNGNTFADPVTGKYTIGVTQSNALNDGTFSITVEAIDVAGNFSAMSPALTITIAPAGTAVAVTSSANPSVFGQSVTFVAVVSVTTSPASGVPTGTVNFFDGTTQIGTGTLATVGSRQQTSITISSLDVLTSPHAITAVYVGTPSFSMNTSPVLSQVVNPIGTATALNATPSSIKYGQTVTLTATVSVTGGGSGTPTGTVNFFDGTTMIGSSTLSPVSGQQQATITDSTLTATPSTHSITAVYVGVTDFATSTSQATTVTVMGLATTTSNVTSSVNPSTIGQSVKFTATVSATGGGTPTGSVTFMDGTTPIGMGTLSGGSAFVTVATLSAGSHQITASYSGDTQFAGSSSLQALTQTVNRDNSVVSTVSADINPATATQTVTLTVTVTGATFLGVTPTGTVTYLEGTKQIGTAPLTGGTAQLLISTLSVGTHSITASYGGDGNFNAGTSSGTLSEVINLASTTTTLGSSVNPAAVGQTVKFTATVAGMAPAAGTPSGTVIFTIDGKAQPGVTLDSSGKATLSVSNLGQGSHTITASYGGDANFNGSPSNTVTQTINIANTSVFVSFSPSAPSLGQSLTITALVSRQSPGTGIPGGLVAFTIDGIPAGSPTLDATGKASVSIASLGVGTHTVTAAYSGDSNDGISSAGPVGFSVGRGSATTTLSSSSGQVVSGKPITFTATVAAAAPASGTPTGTVTFFDGNVNLGSSSLQNGVASVTVTLQVFGAHSITASYGGDATFNPGNSSAPLVITVGSPNQAYVAQLYLDLLHRPADPGGLQHWSSLIDAGVSRASVVLGIEGSFEYRSDVVDALYVQLLHRHADPVGLPLFANALGQGASVEAVEATLIGSPEYFNTRGGGTNGGFLSAVYEDVLSRPIDPTGAAAFGLLLSQGLTPRSSIASLIISSQEGLSDRVNGWYLAYLHRKADPFGLNSFVNALAHGATDQQIIADIVSSDEYFARI
jgi:subtilisin-like proprotein convertase family protein